MSRKTYTTNAGAFPTNMPIPVLEPPVKTGNGKATFKTATAAANAARDARDEAKQAAERSRLEGIACENAKQLCELCAESMYRTYKRDWWWKIAILAGMLLDLFVRLTT